VRFIAAGKGDQRDASGFGALPVLATSQRIHADLSSSVHRTVGNEETWSDADTPRLLAIRRAGDLCLPPLGLPTGDQCAGQGQLPHPAGVARFCACRLPVLRSKQGVFVVLVAQAPLEANGPAMRIAWVQRGVEGARTGYLVDRLVFCLRQKSGRKNRTLLCE
jgi:hypothetical protein